MDDDNVVISFAERLNAKKKQEDESKEEVIYDEEETSEKIASRLYAELEEEIKRQKENVEIWSDTFDDLFNDCDSIGDLINYAQTLSMYSTSILDNIIDSELNDEHITGMVALSLQENNKPILDLGHKLNELINKEKK